MGFLDKAKKMAEQAQTKLDEVQKQFNENQPHPPSSGSQPPPVEYDQHGRPIRSEAPPAASTPPHGDPIAEQPSTSAPPPPQPSAAPTPDPAAPPPAASAPPEPPAAPPPGPPEGVEEDRNNPSYEPPKLSSGDPLM